MIAKIAAIAATAVVVAATIVAGRTGFGRAKGGGQGEGPMGIFLNQHQGCREKWLTRMLHRYFE